MRVQPDYEDADAIARRHAILVSYTCDVRPSRRRAAASSATGSRRGGRWVALHGTNSALGDASVRPVATPRPFPLWVDTLGSQFIAHPPIAALPRRDHASPTTGSSPASSRSRPTDELYLSEYPDRDGARPAAAHHVRRATAARLRRERLDDRRSAAPRDVPAPARRRRGAVQHARALPRPLRHGARRRTTTRPSTAARGSCRCSTSCSAARCAGRRGQTG